MNNIYKTKDLSESAALLLSKQHLLEIKREGKICWFIFENKQECAQISDKFFFGDLLVNAREYYQALATLKKRIFAGT